MKPRFRYPSGLGLAALGALCLLAAPSVLQLLGDPANAAASGQTVIAGPNGGRAICSEPVASPIHKEVVCFLDAYKNAGSNVQAYRFPVAFQETPGMVMTVEGQEPAGRASLPLPVNTTEPLTGWSIVVGF
jgi:hypothetical protein